MLESVGRDIRYAVRSLRRTPGFATAAILTLALGIGANVTVFSLLDAVLLKPLSLPAAGELVTLYENPREGAPDTSGGTGRYLRFSYPRFERLARALGAAGSLAATTRSARFIVRVPNNPQPHPARVQLVSGGYFATLRVEAAHGRILTPDDLRHDGAQSVAVVGDGFWKRVLGGSADAVGRTVLVGDVAATIVGVAPPGFLGTWTDQPADIWLPLTLQQPLRLQGNASTYGNFDRDEPWMAQDAIAWLNLIGRIPSERRPSARAALAAANEAGLRDLAATLEDPGERASMVTNRLGVEPLARGFSGLRARFSDALFALATMVVVVLLVTCANIANLFVARSFARSRELAVRVAMGASRRMLVQQCLVESGFLALAGGAAGLLMAYWVGPLLASAVLDTTPDQLSPTFSLDGRVLTFTATVALVSALVSGLVPAVRGTRLAARSGLGQTPRHVSARSAIRGMRPLVALQFGLSLVVVFASVLLGRTLVNLSRLDPGFATTHVVSVALESIMSGYGPAQYAALNRRLVATVRSVPGVESAAVSRCGLLANCSSSSLFRIEGYRDGATTQLSDNSVGAGYFRTVGIPLVAGREFDERDTERSAPVAIVSESVARHYFGGQSPIGRHIADDAFTAEIVAVVRDTRPISLRDVPLPMVYFPITQQQDVARSLEVRVAGDAQQSVPDIRRALQRSEPGLVLGDVNAMARQVDRNLSRERVVAYLASAFGALALALSCLGLYGVLSYAVTGRTAEFGVRMALGARPADVTRLVVGDGLGVVGGGMALGFAGAVATGQAMRSLVFDVDVLDPLTGAAAAGVLAVSALAACYAPARRARRVDPAIALRAE